MSTIQVFLNSRFNSKGVADATGALQKLKKAVEELNLSAGDKQQITDIFKRLEKVGAGRGGMQEQIALFQRLSKIFLEASQNAKLLGDSQKAIDFKKLGSEANELAQAIANLSEVEKTRVETNKLLSISEHEAISIIQNKIRALDEEGEALRKRAQIVAASGSETLQEDLQQEIRAIAGKITALNKLLDVEDRVETSTLRLSKSGDKFNDAIRRASGNLAGIIGKMNAFAFGVFITQSSINTFIGLFEKLFGVIEKGAGAIDRVASFNRIVNEAGIGAKDLSDRLESAADGAVKLDLAYDKVIKLLKAGLPEVAKGADELLAIAVASAKLSGDMSKVEDNYDKLINGIIRGQPLLIDNTDILIKQGQAMEDYANKINKTADQLNAQERKIATYQAVLQEGQRILEQAGDAEELYSLKLQQTKNALKETGDVWRNTFTIGLIEMIDAVTGALAGQSFELKNLKDNAVDAGAAILASGAAIQQFFEAGQQRMAAFHSVERNLDNIKIQQNDLLDQLVTGKIGWKEYREEAQKLKNLRQTIIDNVNATLDQASAVKSISGLYAEMHDRLAGVTNAANELTGGLGGVLSSFQDLQAQEIILRIKGALDPGLDTQVSEKEQAAKEAFNAALEKAELTRNTKLTKIRDDYLKTLERIQESRNEKIANIEEDLGIKLNRINEDLSIKLQQITEDTEFRRQQIKEKAAKKREKLARDHQRRLNDILRKFELDRLSAIIDRDARALFQAERRRDEALRKENETHKQKEKDAQQAQEQALKTERDNEERRRQQAILAAERRREDARKAAERALEDAQQAFIKASKAAKEAARERKEAAQLAYEQERRDLKDKFRKDQAAIDKWRKKQLIKQIKADTAQRLKKIETQAKESGDLASHLGELEKLYEDYATRVNSILGGINSAAVPNGGGATGFDPNAATNGTSNIRAGRPCNLPPGVNFRGSDGRYPYQCENGRWVYKGNSGIPLVGQGIGAGVGVAPTTRSLPLPGIGRSEVTQIGVSRPATVRLIVENDNTLEAILKEISYEAFIEVVGE